MPPGSAPAPRRGEVAAVVLEYESGVVVLGRLDSGDWLAILAVADADIGPLLHDLREHGPALAALLDGGYHHMRWAVLLAGGSGTRFWPLSTPGNPKQLLPLSGSASSAEEAIERLNGLIARERILVVTGETLADRVQELLRIPATNVLVEPRAASTGPALIWATWEAQRRDPDAEVLSLHADWAVGDAAAFRRTADLALSTARTHDRLVTVGVVPSRPETGYGYIVPGAPLDDSSRTVARFSEKPDAATALDLMAAEALWNTGLFAWTAPPAAR